MVEGAPDPWNSLYRQDQSKTERLCRKRAQKTGDSQIDALPEEGEG
jgi:hypothetical protein